MAAKEKATPGFEFKLNHHPLPSTTKVFCDLATTIPELINQTRKPFFRTNISQNPYSRRTHHICTSIAGKALCGDQYICSILSDPSCDETSAKSPSSQGRFIFSSIASTLDQVPATCKRKKLGLTKLNGSIMINQ